MARPPLKVCLSHTVTSTQRAKATAAVSKWQSAKGNLGLLAWHASELVGAKGTELMRFKARKMLCLQG